MKSYTCKYCGKLWNNNLSRNGHQSRCLLNPKRNLTIKKTSLTLKSRASTNKVDKIIYSILCVKCGKKFLLQLTLYLYNSGKYRKHCSRSCANSRTWTELDNLKKSTTNKNSEKVKTANNRPRTSKLKVLSKACPVCKKLFGTKVLHRTYCSRLCYLKDNNCQYRNVGRGGYRKGSGIGKSGWYKGIYCDSSWLLAYVIYHIDHGLNIARNKLKRSYIWNDELHIYIPDFITDLGIILIKGYKSKQWNEKYKNNTDIKVLYKLLINPYLDYAISKYGKNFIRLYLGNI